MIYPRTFGVDRKCALRIKAKVKKKQQKNKFDPRLWFSVAVLCEKSDQLRQIVYLRTKLELTMQADNRYVIRLP